MSDRYINLDKMLAGMRSMLADKDPDHLSTKIFNLFIARLELEPTADVVEVRHGEWTLNPDGSGTCSECKCTQKHIWDMDNIQSFCGKCGAKMDGGIKQ
jgi:hypothetical protein